MQEHFSQLPGEQPEHSSSFQQNKQANAIPENPARMRAAMGNQPPSMQEQQYRYAELRTRGGCLTTWLVIITLANTLGLIFGLIAFTLLGPLTVILLISNVIGLIAVIGMWQFKKWGYYTLMTLYSLNLVILLLSLGTRSVITVLATILGMVITWLLVHNKWEDFE